MLYVYKYSNNKFGYYKYILLNFDIDLSISWYFQQLILIHTFIKNFKTSIKLLCYLLVLNKGKVELM